MTGGIVVKSPGFWDGLVTPSFLVLPMFALMAGGPISKQAGAALALGSCIAIYAAIFVIWIVIAVWVYRDATARGMNGALWVLIVLLVGVIGLVIYLVLRGEKPLLQQPPYAQYAPGPAVGAPPPAPDGADEGSGRSGVYFMGVGAAERLDKVPIINKVPKSMRVLVVVLIVALLVIAVSSAAFFGSVLSAFKESQGADGNSINPEKLEDFSWSSDPIHGSMSEYQESMMPLSSMLSNRSVMVDAVGMHLEWVDEPDQTWAGRNRENSPDSFQLRIEIGAESFESEMTPNGESNKEGSVDIQVFTGSANYTYVVVGNSSGLQLPEGVGEVSIDLYIVMGEAGDLYASGPALFKLNDLGNDYTLTVYVTGKVLPD